MVYLIHEKHAEEVETINQKVQGEQTFFISYVLLFPRIQSIPVFLVLAVVKLVCN